MSVLPVLRIKYGNYSVCKGIIRREQSNKKIHLIIESNTKTYFFLDTYPNVEQLTVGCNIRHINGKHMNNLTYLKITRSFPELPMMSSLTTLHCISDVCEIPTLPNLKSLTTNCPKIMYQPVLEELNIAYTNITKLPDTPKLKVLVCNDTGISDLPNYTQLEFLLCFDTKISNIPESVCNTIQRCYTGYKPIFISKPVKLIEAFSFDEDVHYLKEGELNCIEYDGPMQLVKLEPEQLMQI